MLKFIRNFLVLSLLILPAFLLLPTSSASTLGNTYEQATFERLLKEGKPVLVAVHADWCGTCRTQDAFLTDLLKNAPYNTLNVLRVDFDTQKDALRTFKVRWQSTLIVFKDGKEVERSTADTDKNSVAVMLRKAL